LKIRTVFAAPNTALREKCAVGGNILEAMQPTLTRARKGLENELAKVTIAEIAAEVARLGKSPSLYLVGFFEIYVIVSMTQCPIFELCETEPIRGAAVSHEFTPILTGAI